MGPRRKNQRRGQKKRVLDQATRNLVVAWNRSPAEHQAFRDTFPARRAEVEASIRRHMDGILDAIRKFDPLELLAGHFIAHQLGTPATYVESETTSREHQAEYLLSLVTAIESADLGHAAPPEDVHEMLTAHLDGLFRDLVFQLCFAERKATAEGLEELQATLFFAGLQVRGDSFPSHHEDLFRSLAAPNSEELKRAYGFTSDELVSTVRGIGEQLQERLDEMGQGLAKDARELLRVDLADARISEAVLQVASTAPGENRAFLLEPAAALPAKDSLITTRPVLRIGTEYFAASPTAIERNCVALLEHLLGESSSYADAFQKKRAAVLEQLAVGYLERLLPGCTKATNLYYRRTDGELAETDAVLVLDNSVFVVEAKAGGLSSAARRGAPRSIKTAFSKLVEHAFRQGTAVREHIMSGPTAEFLDAKGNVVLTIQRKDVDDVFVVNPTLASLGHLGVQLGLARELGLLSDGVQWPWCVFINDLRVISELIGSPTEFLVFLERRFAANNEPYSSGDELDLLCKFFDDGLYNEPGEFRAVDRIALVGYTDVLDRWYIGRPNGAEDVEKPGLELPSVLRELVLSLEQCGKRRRTLAARWLVRMDHEGHEQVSSFVIASRAQYARDGKPHDLTMQSRELGQGVTLHLNERGEVDDHCRAHAGARARLAGAALWLIIAWSPDGVRVDFEFLDGDSRWFDARSAEALRQHRIAKYRETNTWPPPRNEACPCGSGKKFKKCCWLTN